MRLFCLLLLWSISAFGKPKEVNLDFLTLMGKHTSHWHYVQQAQDWVTLDLSQSLYLKNKEAQFMQMGPFKIPSVVHFIWLGPKPFPPQSVENVRTWIAMNPGWRVKFWTDREREPPCTGMETILIQDAHFSRLGTCYRDSQNWGEKSDVLRYEILFQEGGVYVDHDANCLLAFDGIHRGYDFYCCLETPHEPFVGRNITCGNGVVGSRPNHPTIGKVIDLIQENWEEIGKKFCGKDEYSRIEVVMQRTYIALTLALKGTIDLPGNVDIIFPAAHFFSKSGIRPIYSQHFYASAWDEFKFRKTEIEKIGEKSLGKMQQKSSNLLLAVIAALTLNVVILGFCLYQLKLRSHKI